MNQKSLRKVDTQDMERLYEWANEETTRNNSIQTHRIEPEEHRLWFYNKMKQCNCDMFIYSVNEIPIGQIRLDYQEHCGWISFSIDQRYRGQGHGLIILQLAELEVKKSRPGMIRLAGLVKKNNLPSQKIFEKMQYKLNIEYADKDILLYEKNL